MEPSIENDRNTPQSTQADINWSAVARDSWQAAPISSQVFSDKHTPFSSQAFSDKHTPFSSQAFSAAEGRQLPGLPKTADLLISQMKAGPSNSELIGTIARDYLSGMHQEAKEHPGQLATEALLGAAASAMAVWLPKQYSIPIAAVGTALALLELGKGTIHLADNASILANPETFSMAELQQAHSRIRDMGATSIHNLAVAAGGVTGMEATRLGMLANGYSLPIPGRMPILPILDSANLKVGA